MPVERKRNLSYPENVQSLISSIKNDIIVGRVTDIILNDEHKLFQEYGKYNGIGTIFWEENNKIGSVQGEAIPFFPQINTPPLVNELVLLFNLPNKNMGKNTSSNNYYYINILNIWNSPHHNAYPNPLDSLSPQSQQKDYLQTKAGSTVRQIDEDGTGINLNVSTTKSTTQQTFNEKSDIHPLLAFTGDVIYEGRWGNSLRFGSTTKPNNTFSLNDWSDVGKNGNPITILRNGQYDENTPGYIPTVENINFDKSSIYLTSNQKIPIKIRDGYKLNSYSSKISLPEEYIGSQVIINSDRLVLNSKKDHTLISGKKSVNLSSDGTLNFDTDQLIMHSRLIKLGSKNADQPLVKGNVLKDDLDFMLQALLQIVSVLKDAKLWPGGNVTLDTGTSITAFSTEEALNNIHKNLGDILSKTVKTL